MNIVSSLGFVLANDFRHSIKVSNAILVCSRRPQRLANACRGVSSTAVGLNNRQLNDQLHPLINNHLIGECPQLKKSNDLSKLRNGIAWFNNRSRRGISSMTNSRNQVISPMICTLNQRNRYLNECQQQNHVHTEATSNGHRASSNASENYTSCPVTTTTTTTTSTNTNGADAHSTRRNLSTSANQNNHENFNPRTQSKPIPSDVNLFYGKPQQHTARQQYLTMANIHKLVLEPTREHVENIRHLLSGINAKDNNNQQITLEKDQASGIATICIKSAAMNGISAKMMCDLLDIIDELYAWPEGKGVLIYGHKGFFCSGGDLVSIRELANYEDGLKMATLMQYNLARLQALPMITMALIQGKAIGGGAEIAVTTDLRAMTSSSRIGYVHCRVGIIAAWGGGSRLVQLVGPSRAVELMTSGRLVSSSEALQLGLVNEIIDDSGLGDDQVIERGKQYLQQHIMGAKTTLMAIKNLVNAARTLPLEQALVVEGQLLSSTWGKQAHMEALNNNVKHRGDNSK